MNLQHVCYRCVVITTKLHWNYNAITMLLLRIALVRVWYTNVSRSIAHWFTITLQHVAIEFRWHAACASTLVTFTHVSVHTSTMRAYYIQPLIYICIYVYIREMLPYYKSTRIIKMSYSVYEWQRWMNYRSTCVDETIDGQISSSTFEYFV
jgi:hypothetical protein